MWIKFKVMIHFLIWMSWIAWCSLTFLYSWCFTFSCSSCIIFPSNDLNYLDSKPQKHQHVIIFVIYVFDSCGKFSLLKKIVYAYLFIQIKDFEQHFSAIRENGEVLEVSPWLCIQSLLFFFSPVRVNFITGWFYWDRVLKVQITNVIVFTEL